MNLNLSRKLCLLIATSILIGLMNGCTFLNREGSQVQQQDHLESPEKETVPQYTISWTMHQNIAVPEDAEMIAYIEDQFDVDLEVWNLENKRYEELLDLELAQGKIPDLFRIRQPHDLLKYQMQGVLAEISRKSLNNMRQISCSEFAIMIHVI